jgi:2-polyprenyl-3-methyl-5-hydroxy-6-metoxy-1,4-benzoquinol methylase
MSDLSKQYYNELQKETVDCPVCKSNKYEVLHKEDRYQMGVQTVICKQCSLIYINPRPTELEMADFYKNHYRNFYESIEIPTLGYIKKGPFIPRAKFVLNVINKYLEKANSILDVGCAEGTLLKLIEENNSTIKTYGIEPSNGFGNFAKNQLNGSVFIGGYKQFAEQNSSTKYDVITTTHVLEHILRPKIFIEHLKGFMHAESVLYIEVPNIMSEKLKGIGAIHIGHVLSYDPVTLKILLQDCGLEIIDFYAEGLPALTPAMAVVCKINKDSFKVSFPDNLEITKKINFFKDRIVGIKKENELDVKKSILQKIKSKLLR